MNCPHCAQPARRYGRNRNGSQRFRCYECRKTFTDETTRPPDRRELPADKAVMCVRMILEGASVRSIERLTGVHRDTILGLLVDAGRACERFLETRVRNVPVADVEADEIWSFVGCKEKTRERQGYDDSMGDAWCFVAIERTSKLVLTYHLGKRNPVATREFTCKLRAAAAGWFQLSTDGYVPYRNAVRQTFGQLLDFAQLVKVYGRVPEEGSAARYSPPEVVSVYSLVFTGQPDPDRVCTSHAERQNLSMRMTLRRLTRLTNGHSKKWQNHAAALALYFAFYNFCRAHTTLTTRNETKAKTTPAMAAGLTDHVWSVAELLATAA